MALRVTVATTDDATTVQVDGRLSARDVGELGRVVRGVEGRVILDLSNLQSADDTGVATLRTLAGQGAQLVGASPYIALLLHGEDMRSAPRSSRETRRRS